MRYIQYLLWFFIASSQAQEFISAESDLLQKGPYEFRYNSRLVGNCVMPKQVPIISDSHNQHLIANRVTNDTCEISILINSIQTRPLSKLTVAPIDKITKANGVGMSI